MLLATNVQSVLSQKTTVGADLTFGYSESKAQYDSNHSVGASLSYRYRLSSGISLAISTGYDVTRYNAKENAFAHAQQDKHS